MFAKSRTERADPTLASPYTLIDEPSRENERMETQLPILIKSNDDSELPMEAIP
jgi:hypothetical protein